MFASAGTLDATFSASSSEESYCWTAIWHVSELDWPAEESMVVALFHLKVLHYSVPIRYRYFAWPTAILPLSTLKAHSGLALILSICYGGYRSRATVPYPKAEPLSFHTSLPSHHLDSYTYVNLISIEYFAVLSNTRIPTRTRLGTWPQIILICCRHLPM